MIREFMEFLKVKSDKLEGLMYHYTSIDGLLGITKDKYPTLYFSKFDCLNDKEEFTNYIKFFKKIVEKHKNDYDSILIDKLLNYIPSMNSLWFSDCKEHEYMFYICSFSVAGDALPMWRYYLKNKEFSGCSIGFTNLNDIMFAGQPFDFYDSYIKHVVYNDDIKEEGILKLLGFISNIDSQKVDLYYSINDFVIHNAIFSKDKSFSGEEEIRIVIETTRDNDAFEIKYRNVNGYIVPYIEIDFEDKNCIKKIILPPNSSEDKLDNIKNYLDSKNDKNIEIVFSKINVRY